MSVGRYNSHKNKIQVIIPMRVLCPHCQHKAFITASNRQSSAVTEIYCRCDNHECQAGFVMTLSHKHDTQPPVNSLHTMIGELLKRLSPEERKELLSDS